MIAFLIERLPFKIRNMQALDWAVVNPYIINLVTETGILLQNLLRHSRCSTFFD